MTQPFCSCLLFHSHRGRSNASQGESGLLSPSSEQARPYNGVGTSQASEYSAACHSCSSAALRARQLMRCGPNSAALLALGAPPKTSACQVISQSTDPAATTVALR